MYVFLLIISILITFSLFLKFNKKNFSFNDYIKYITLFSVLTIFFIHLLILIINGNFVNMNYELKNITPLFVIKYLFLSFISAVMSLLLYKIIIKTEIDKNKLIINKRTIVNLILFGILINLIFIEKYFIDNYDNVPLEQLIFHLRIPLEGTATDVIFDFVTKAALPAFVLIILLVLLTIPITKYSLKINFKNKNYNYLPFNLNKKIITVMIIVLTIGTIGYIIYRFDVIGFIKYQNTTSEFIEKNYVNPNDVKIDFPKKKKNLIYIYLESMEATYMDSEHDGILENNLIPNLYKLAQKEINFSNNSDVGGFLAASETTWTVASMVAQTSGLPMKFNTQLSINNINNGLFLPTVITLGDILEKNGYKNYLYLGSKASFASRDVYFKSHGNYEIFDYDEAIKSEKIDKDYYVWWGYEDKKLIEFSKEKLKSISKDDQPFNFTMLTVDTHPNGGYLDETCEVQYDKNIENVISCNDKMIIDFIDWIKKQDFYENTTIIVTGDHLNMDTSFIEEPDNRYIYNAIINSSVKPKNEKNRVFNTFDMFPTSLASMGVKIEGDRLGLGTNMFSDKKTLYEKKGIDYVNDEISKKSKFYQKLSLGKK